ncbi:MAG: DUF885 domain-containing protein [Xanthomonadales bacterium]|jgi:uncharacterized protein (DUF885 family)|nr:DUF885 domain-containing protein [Xanthomonadales bacterium]
MNPNIKFARLSILFLLIFGGSLAADGDDAEAFRAICEKEWAFRMSEFPMMASWTGHDGGADRMGRVSEADQQRRHAFWKGIRTELEGISCERLDREGCINYRIFRRQVDNFLADYETGAYLVPFNSDWGFYMAWSRLPANTRFDSTDDYRNYLARLHELPAVMDEYIALMRRGIELGMTQPRVVLDGRDAPIRAEIVDAVEDSGFYAPFRELPESGDRAALLAAARKVIANEVIPAYRSLYTFFHEEYLPGARTTLGASELPDGEAFYRAQVRRYATVDMTPREIHEIGLAEVARIRSEMEEIIEEVGFEGDFAAFLEFLRTDPQFYAKTGRELLSIASYYAKKIDGRLPAVIGHLPRQPYGVAPVPETLAPFYTAGRYAGAPLNAQRGGYYWVNTHALESRPLYAIPALTLHEAAPGHHIQSALAREQDEKPPFRRHDYISAYGEGWALYAEKLGVEMGIYETPYEHFGRLTYEMWRACRLVIDTGIHAMGWTREQALDYLRSNTALSEHEVTTEIDRYISWPGQALSYKLGEYTIWQLRGRAEETLGDAFDLRAFHDFILSLGSVPLDVLSDEVEYWIAQQG